MAQELIRHITDSMNHLLADAVEKVAEYAEHRVEGAGAEGTRLLIEADAKIERFVKLGIQGGGTMNAPALVAFLIDQSDRWTRNIVGGLALGLPAFNPESLRASLMEEIQENAD